jgi:hypothetical protein
MTDTTGAVASFLVVQFHANFERAIGVITIPRSQLFNAEVSTLFLPLAGVQCTFIPFNVILSLGLLLGRLNLLGGLD